MRAVILAGGLGMRLRPYTTILPKPLVPVGDRPILEHIIRRLADCGVTSVDVCVGHLGELIRVYFSQQDKLPEDLDLRWHWEDAPLGTAGALGTVPGLDETFIAMNGDVLTTLDYRELVAYHRAHDAVLTVATKSKRVEIDLGVVENSGGLITDYREKPSLDYQVSMGIYVYEPRVLDYLPDGLCQFPDLVLKLLDAGERVAAFPSDAEWYDIGTMQEYELAMQALELRPSAFSLEAAIPPLEAGIDSALSLHRHR
ncbi:MAG: sugar phosphate nucleotidyltransferase [Solirubrobacteraceae bacterium]